MDAINGFFELLGALLICLSIRRLYRDRSIRGVSTIPTAFFALWGWWNLLFYPAVGAWWSFYGGLFMVAANSVWLLQMGYFTINEKYGERIRVFAEGV